MKGHFKALGQLIKQQIMALVTVERSTPTPQESVSDFSLSFLFYQFI